MVSAHRGRCWFQFLESEATHTPPPPLCVCLSLTSSLSGLPLCFSLCPLTCMPLLAGGFVCIMPWREPSCTDVLPGLQFLAFAWSSHPSRTTGPDEELQRLHLAASHSTWGFCPQTSSPPSTTSLILSASLKQGKLPRGGIHHCFGPGRYV